MMLSESAAHPAVASLTQSAYDQLISDGEVDYHVLSDMIGEASGMGNVTELRVALTVEDFDRAVAFYRDALGLEQIAD